MEAEAEEPQLRSGLQLPRCRVEVGLVLPLVLLPGADSREGGKAKETLLASDRLLPGAGGEGVSRSASSSSSSASIASAAAHASSAEAATSAFGQQRLELLRGDAADGDADDGEPAPVAPTASRETRRAMRQDASSTERVSEPLDGGDGVEMGAVVLSDAGSCAVFWLAAKEFKFRWLPAAAPRSTSARRAIVSASSRWPLSCHWFSAVRTASATGP